LEENKTASGIASQMPTRGANQIEQPKLRKKHSRNQFVTKRKRWTLPLKRTGDNKYSTTRSRLCGQSMITWEAVTVPVNKEDTNCKLRVNPCVRTKGLFRCKNFLDFDTVALSFLFDKHYLIME